MTFMQKQMLLSLGSQRHTSHLLTSEKIKHGSVSGEPQEARVVGADRLGWAGRPALPNIHAYRAARDICETRVIKGLLLTIWILSFLISAVHITTSDVLQILKVKFV